MSTDETASKEMKQDFHLGSKNLELQISEATDQLKVEISRGIEQPWDNKPLRFQDALGRRYPIPIEICGSFEVSTLSYIVLPFHRYTQPDVDR